MKYVEKLSSSFTEIIYILKYIQIVILDCNISQIFFFYKINAALSIFEFFLKNRKFYQLQTFKW